MSIEKAKTHLKQQLALLERQAGQVRRALVVLGGEEIAAAKNGSKKAAKKGFKRSAEWRNKIAVAQKKRWAAFRAKRAEGKK